MIICLTGMPGSGKTEVARMLQEKGFKVFEMSSAIKEMMTERGIEVNVKSLEDFAMSSRKLQGMGVFAVELAKRIKVKKGQDVLISGMRNMDEFAYLKRYFKNMVIIALAAPKKLRFERLRRRDPKHVITYKEFVYREKTNMREGIGGALKHADYIILNTGSFAELKKSVNYLLGCIEKGKIAY
ncbi:MAG: AAA family ATPase [Candidatus Micrarchaeota archaeon]|nr:AAA family ATPase [Candidatus Micrarchaeota archaeon]MDE1824583.1 AAA family ATPase [Candidatus Micrarchaeota archaeon]MDE1850073.1 AAA family ATPase [Candidatus Micrarchaeota archaeon]